MNGVMIHGAASATTKATRDSGVSTALAGMPVARPS
jgi:hypothetical protein